MSKESPRTVRLNVGGTKYEVAMSLFERYLDSKLATMINKRWKQHEEDEFDEDKADRTTNEDELFIDRNGHRFQYVLDYMRDRQVHLAAGSSCASIRKELEYFGFDNVPNDAIVVASDNLDATKPVDDSSGYLDTTNSVFSVNQEYKRIVKNILTNGRLYRTVKVLLIGFIKHTWRMDWWI